MKKKANKNFRSFADCMARYFFYGITPVSYSAGTY